AVPRGRRRAWGRGASIDELREPPCRNGGTDRCDPVTPVPSAEHERLLTPRIAVASAVLKARATHAGLGGRVPGGARGALIVAPPEVSRDRGEDVVGDGLVVPRKPE